MSFEADKRELCYNKVIEYRTTILRLTEAKTQCFTPGSFSASFEIVIIYFPSYNLLLSLQLLPIIQDTYPCVVPCS